MTLEAVYPCAPHAALPVGQRVAHPASRARSAHPAMEPLTTLGLAARLQSSTSESALRQLARSLLSSSRPATPILLPNLATRRGDRPCRTRPLLTPRCISDPSSRAPSPSCFVSMASKSARRGFAARPSGATNEHLRILLDDDEDARLLYGAASRLANAAPHFQAACMPYQCGLSTRVGTDAVSRLLRAATDTSPRATVLSVDLELQRLLPVARQFYASPSSYTWIDDDGHGHQVTQGEGGEQGDPLMPALYALAKPSTTCTTSSATGKPFSPASTMFTSSPY